MADSDITVTDLAAKSVAGGVKLSWSVTDPNANGLPYRSLEAVEVWAATTNDRSSATKIGEGRTDFTHIYLPVETFFYYWIRPRDVEGSYGDWYPSGSTSGVVGGTTGLAGLSFALMGGQIVAEVDSGGDLIVSIETAAGETPSAGNPVFVAFANTTAGPPVVGGYTIRQITSALSVTITHADKLDIGAQSAFNIYVCVFDNDGTPLLALINCRGSGNEITPLAYMAPASTTTTVDRGVFVAGSAVSNKYYRIVARLVWNDGLTTAWVVPDRIDMHSMDSKLPGEVVQEIISASETPESATDQLIPLDDTRPQWSEGTDADLNSLVEIVPTCGGNILECEATVPLAFSTTGYLTLALFGDPDNNGTPNASALAAAIAYSGASGDIQTLSLKWRQVADQVTAIGFMYRYGSDVNGTIYICTLPSGDIYSFGLQRRFVVREIAA